MLSAALSSQDPFQLHYIATQQFQVDFVIAEVTSTYSFSRNDI
ncbi:hypothetical protein FHS68_000715 [Dyadobacter arcticus]|uniref:Uncharacterized protein n=1 Tax=Dyadobacter arcticus TaxID=1078754 RepID=A0ABX0UEY0_9BACT|nr:hypothetical protein [Dyadobacter arcticus]